MFKENFLEVSLLLEPHHEERVDIAQEYGIDIMKFALMQAIFDECFLSEKHIQYIPPFALFFLILAMVDITLHIIYVLTCLIPA